MDRRQMFRALAAPAVALVAGAEHGSIAPTEVAPAKVVIEINGRMLVAQLVEELERGGHACQRLRAVIDG